MGLFNWLRRPSQPDPEETSGEQAVLLHIRLGNDHFGLEGETATMYELEDELRAVIEAARIGELDGHEFGGGECVIFMYGRNAEAIWEVIAPTLEKKPFRKGSFAIKRFGGPESDRQERVDLHWDG